MNYMGKVVVWISSASLGHEPSTELARMLSTGDISSECEVHMMASDVELSTEPISSAVKALKYADIFIMGDKVIPSKKLPTFALEKSLFPASYSKYKRALLFASEVDNKVYSDTVRKGRELNPKEVGNKYFSDWNADDVDYLYSVVVNEIKQILSLDEIDKDANKLFNIGVAIELLKGGLHTISKKSWSSTKTLRLKETQSGDKHIRMYDAQYDVSIPWIPEPSDLMDEDYFTIR